MSDEPFFIGWESKSDASLSSFLKGVSAFGVVGIVVLAGLLAFNQQTVSSSGKFDYGNVRTFSGILVNEPVPMLVGDDDAMHYLVAPLKNGFPAKLASSMHLQQVELQGTFIGDDLDTMIEVLPETVRSLGNGNRTPLQITLNGSFVTLRGEIVDSKCYLGVMNPGRFKSHRACAIQCIAGGIPPILVMQDGDGTLAHVLLVAADGSAINDFILEHVAEPVELSGNLKTIGGRNVLFADVDRLKRL